MSIAQIRIRCGYACHTCCCLPYLFDHLIAHELAHQWWGSFVSNESRHDVWLTEGLATHSEALWRGYAHGDSRIYDEYFPQYACRWQCDIQNNTHQLTLQIDQVQIDTGIFNLPITAEVTLADGSRHREDSENNTAHSEYRITLPSAAENVQLDPDGWILKQIIEPIENATFDRGILSERDQR